MNELSFHWSMRKLRFRCPPSFVPTIQFLSIISFSIAFIRFYTYVRTSHYLSIPRLNVVTKFLHVHDLYKDIDKIQISELYLKIQFFEIKIRMGNGDFYKNIGQTFAVGCISIECLKTRTLKIFTIVMAIDRSR